MIVEGYANIYQETSQHPFEFSVFIYGSKLGANAAPSPGDHSITIKKAMPIRLEVPEQEKK